MESKKRHIYVNINEQTVLLILICNILGISKYQMFLLYETFGNDCFLFFDLLQKAGTLPRLTNFRLRRCSKWAEMLTPVLLGGIKPELSPTEQKVYMLLNPLLYENKFKIEEDVEAY